MEWTDEGIVVGVRRHGEANAILDVLTVGHGRHLGLVRGGAGSRLRPVLQPGNAIQVNWRARLDEHLGHYTVEALRLRAAAFLTQSHALYGLAHLCALMRLLPERDPHPELYAAFDGILEVLADARGAAVLVARFELQLLAELGFGLDLEECAATGAREQLVYVSPKSGRAVSLQAGAPWHDRLLALPAFLSDDADRTPVATEELAAGFALTSFFLNRYVLQPRGAAMPEERARFVAAALRATGGERQSA